ncbi:MAG: GIY-YIG nuclease family protein [Candidatus Portnoybacteria bacterium]|nr:GIY-YIG nuclease family protein [Candidatus Portnoybacteria bacterium]MDD4982599.1 GIY-YIG nuclease family protein [Candidatus Portnoybacteria bacterium]
MHYVYVLKSDRDGNWYTGYTNDLQKRILEHNKGLNFATKDRRPLKFIYCEASLNEKDAKAREKYLKSGMGKKYLKNRLKFFFAI